MTKEEYLVLAADYQKKFPVYFKSYFNEVTNIYGVGPKGIEKLKSTIQRQKKKTGIVSLIFLEAMLTAAIHSLKLTGRSELKPLASVIRLNYDNILSMPDASFSTKHPQVLLGLRSTWSKEDLVLLKTMMFYYFTSFHPNDTYKIISYLLTDTDLKSWDFSPVSIKLDQSVIDTIKSGFEEILSFQNKKSS